MGQNHIPYARHYNPQFVYFLPTFWSPKTFFQGAFFLKILALCMISIQERFLIKSVLDGARTVWFFGSFNFGK